MGNEVYLKDIIKRITIGEVQELMLTEFDIDMNDYEKSEAMYCSEKTENYEIQSEIDNCGGEGEGEEFWTISKITDLRTQEVFFIRFDAYYSSWDGTDWSNNDWNIVEPNEVKVVQWF